MRSPTKITEVKQLIGQLNWLATQTRPNLSFDMSTLSFILKQENVECIKQINQTVKKAEKEKSQIHIPNLGNPEFLQIIAYSDASFANLTDGGSQGNYIIFLIGSNSRYKPIVWQPKQIKRVVKSTSVQRLWPWFIWLRPACITEKWYWICCRAILREMIDRGEIAAITWIPTDRQIADALTKKRVPSFKILEFTFELKGSSI